MRYIDEDNITQAVIARHAAAPDARLRELMTSLVQHLHGFAREVRLSEDEWRDGIQFLAECGQLCAARRHELALLSDTLGLSMLVSAQNRRKSQGGTESTISESVQGQGLPAPASDDAPGRGKSDEPFYVHGRVTALDGRPIAGAELRIRPCDGRAADDAQGHDATDPRARVLVSGADGGFHARLAVAEPHAIVHDGPVGRMLRALGRHPWRPAHLHVEVVAPGCERLVTDVFRAGDGYLDADAVFGVRRTLVADWVHHPPGRTPDGEHSPLPFCTLDFDFVLNPTTGDKT